MYIYTYVHVYVCRDTHLFYTVHLKRERQVEKKQMRQNINQKI